jgi:hypothetical protein
VMLYLPGLAAAGGIGLATSLSQGGGGRRRRWLGATLFGLVLVSMTMRKTAALYDAVHVDPWVCGVEAASITTPDDHVLVLGIPYHPAVEWYCRRDVRFVDRTDPGELFANTPPSTAMVAKATESFVANAVQLDPSGERFRGRTASALDYLRKHYRVVSSTDHFDVYRRP